ncbi:MAG: MFS transporter [Thermoguttaceae bacterium]|jgi:acyl-[acyl-carrier-protein]-phospholipid O-acyltransferase/long-chain-fatty-acid--[acyl-carrier-protein] ligase
MSGLHSTTAPGPGLRTRSFYGLLLAQFLVALDDNMLRWLVVPIAKRSWGPDAVLSIYLVCFVLPYIVLVSPAGYLADRFSKRSVVVGCQVAVVALMALALATIASGSVPLMFLVLLAVGAQEAMLSPAKLGAIPEVVAAGQIQAANGLIAMTNTLGIILGQALGGVFFSLGDELGAAGWSITAAVLLGIAGLGTAASLAIARLPPAHRQRVLPRNPLSDTLRNLLALASARPLLLAALGSTFFWSLAAMANINIDKFVTIDLKLAQHYTGPLFIVLAVGIGIGNFLAGALAGGRIELGMVPFGALGIAAAGTLMWIVPAGTGAALSGAYAATAALLLLLGLSAGFYLVPLQAFVQERAPPQSRGAILAARNFIMFLGMLISAGLFWLLGNRAGLSARAVFLLCGLATVPLAAGTFWGLRRQCGRFLCRILGRPTVP